jgi:hypothetical protein
LENAGREYGKTDLLRAEAAHPAEKQWRQIYRPKNPDTGDKGKETAE